MLCFQIWVCFQPAGSEHRQSEQRSVCNCVLSCKAESCLGDLPPLGRRESTGGEGQGAFAACSCK